MHLFVRHLPLFFLQMALLAAQNPYIQHLTGNTFVAISEFVVASVCYSMALCSFQATTVWYLF